MTGKGLIVVVAGCELTGRVDWSQLDGQEHMHGALRNTHEGDSPDIPDGVPQGVAHVEGIPHGGDNRLGHGPVTLAVSDLFDNNNN